MTDKNITLHDGKKGAALAVRVTPRASRNEISEVLSDGTVKIHLTAPPVDGEANEALLRFLAKILQVPVTNLDVVAGAKGRDKIISVIDMDAATLHRRIIENIS
jgi:uncharacterized protein